MTEAPDHAVWVGSRDPIGISRLEFAAGPLGARLSARHFGPKDGLGAAKTYFLRFDRRGWLWTALIPVTLGAIRHGEAGADLELKPYDVLLIKPTPMWKEPGIFEIAGEVRFPGKYPIHQGETLRSLLERAGGFTAEAFSEGAVFVREELKKREKEQIELLSNRLQSDLAALSLEAVAD